ncbi:nitrogen fixation protein NifZ [Prodigiosinella confusarubida]|uniref:Nitrogen fixation protein NifZ n=1 Tax=Serratia sp. (strain ATCC 39006) TaxID=104623 RepID=A0A2I5T401_SERS3|nr:nitrogen fixation protein NifZ [Serratia sp. ATCC 39006]AUG99296.1 nitrogen fixation protein NifZ [Serratia sp. ATCC 39006]AUH03614.1 nitrogen fixation protein NifZ [Serratia sp. ATCC 39006]
MTSVFEFGEQVRVIRPLRNDGTFAGKARGELLIRRGSLGYVREWGHFLQDQIIYQVHFISEDCIVGCRQQELISATLPWDSDSFQYGDRVSAAQPLSIQGEIVIAQGVVGHIIGTDEGSQRDCYTVIFGERLFQVPSSALINLEIDG